jgi:predicted nucleotidyltransferase
MKKILTRIKEIIVAEVERAGLKVVSILLFGSRARGEAHSGSDWDFYIIVDRDLGFRNRSSIASRIRWRLASELGIDGDIFIQSESNVNKRMNDTGYLTYYVLKEGVPLE